MESAFPVGGETALAIAQELRRGIAEGWLCNRGEPEARFSRLAKPSPQTHDLSIDVVSLLGSAVAHTHPNGEITLGFAAEAGEARFDGRPPGWVFLGPGTTHTPQVVGARMHLLYFLPQGAVIWESA